MTANWFYKDGPDEQGPLTEVQIRALLFSLNCSGEAAVRQGTSPWFTAESVRKRFAELDAIGWYILFDGKEQGPFTKLKFEEVIAANTFDSLTWVREGKAGKWEPLEGFLAGKRGEHAAGATVPPGMNAARSKEAPVQPPARTASPVAAPQASGQAPILAIAPSSTRKVSSNTITSPPTISPAKDEDEAPHVPYVPIKRREPPSARLALSILGVTMGSCLAFYAIYVLLTYDPATTLHATTKLDMPAPVPEKSLPTAPTRETPPAPASMVEPQTISLGTVVREGNVAEAAASRDKAAAPFSGASKSMAPMSLHALHQLADGPKEFSAADWSIYKERLFVDGYLGLRIEKGVFSYKRSPTQYASVFRAMQQVFADFGYKDPTAKQVYNGAKMMLGGRFVAGSDAVIRQTAQQLKSGGSVLFTEASYQELDR